MRRLPARNDLGNRQARRGARGDPWAVRAGPARRVAAWVPTLCGEGEMIDLAIGILIGIVIGFCLLWAAIGGRF